MVSVAEQAQQIGRRVKVALRATEMDELTREEMKIAQNLIRVSNEIRLDVRDYEYAETLAAQRKAMKAARQNLTRLKNGILELHSVFGPADTAELGALIDSLRSELL